MIAQGRCDASGEFELRGLPPGRLRLSAGHESDRAPTRVDVPAEGRVELRLRAGGTLVGRVLAEDGAPLAGWLVGAALPEHEGRGLFAAQATTGREGEFRLESLLEIGGEYVVEVRPPAGLPGPAYASQRVTVAPSGPPLELVVEDRALPSVHLTGTLRAADGSSLEDARLIVSEGPGTPNRNHAVDSEDGRFELGPLPPGRFHLAASARWARYQPLGELDLAPGARLDLGVIVLEPAGVIAVEIENPELGRRLHCGVRVVESRDALAGIHLSNGAGRSSPLAPGRYLVYVSGRAIHRWERVVEVVAGGEVLVPIRLEPTD